MDRKTLDLWVGLFVCAGIAALIILALKVGNTSTFHVSESLKVYALFDNIGGLKPRAPVKSAGVVVGRVTDISFDAKEYKARVGFTIDKRYSFSKDTSASVLTSGLLGEQYIGLETGAETQMLKGEDVIKITQSAVVLEKLIGQFLYSKAQEAPEKK